MLTKIQSTLHKPQNQSPRVLAYMLRKVMRRLYDGIHVDARGLDRVRTLVAAQSAPVLLLPTHRSYMDFILLRCVDAGLVCGWVVRVAPHNSWALRCDHACGNTTHSSH